MKKNVGVRRIVAACLLCVWCWACEKQESPPQPTKRAEAPVPPQPAPAQQVAKPSEKTESNGGKKLIDEGLQLTIPAEWISEPVEPGPMSAKFAYRLPKVDGDSEDALLRISHYPSMKGKDDPNIDRWLAQVRTADGRPATRADAKIVVTPLGNVRVTLFDITGTVSATMDGSGTGAPNRRMINAILDHPKGPHFLKATGGVNTMAKWQAAIEACAERYRVQLGGNAESNTPQPWAEHKPGMPGTPARLRAG